MAIDMSVFRKRANSEVERLQQAMNNARGTKKTDDTIWRPTLNADGNSNALIRFLYNPEMSDNFYVTLRTHSIKGPGGWYVEKCPRTHGWSEPCPACEMADRLKKGRMWKDIPAHERDIIYPYFSRIFYYANIYVIKDKENPEAEGKVWKYRFKNKIMAKIEAALSEDPLTGAPGFSAFDPINGADFRLTIKQVGGFSNYDDSKFIVPAPFLDGDEEKALDIINNQLYNLDEIVDSSKFRSYEFLTEQFNRVFGENDENEGKDNEADGDPIERRTTRKTSHGRASEEVPVEDQEATGEESTNDGIDDDYFKSLVDDLSA